MPSHRILIVDDERDVLDSWEGTLRVSGYTVQVALTAKDALLLCDEHPFDLVILDFIMPSMNAIELLTRIRKRNPLIRSIIVSGRIADAIADADVNQAFKEAVEADLSLKKPLSNQKLIESIQELLNSDLSKSWKEIAIRSGSAHKATIKRAKQSGRELKQRLTKHRKK